MSASAPFPLLQAHQLTCIREERILFDALDFAVYPGDILQIEGPNGAGKTSLLRILAGLSRPYYGEVRMGQCSIAQCRDEFHSNLIYLGHLAGVKNELTAAENLNFNLRMNGYTDINCSEPLTQVDLAGFEEHPAGHLSAGQHRRIALARLWHSEAKIWILDEPLTAIDKRGIAKLEQLFLQHVEQGGCIILTTHQDLPTLSAERIKTLRLGNVWPQEV